MLILNCRLYNFAREGKTATMCAWTIHLGTQRPQLTRVHGWGGNYGRQLNIKRTLYCYQPLSTCYFRGYETGTGPHTARPRQNISVDSTPTTSDHRATKYYNVPQKDIVCSELRNHKREKYSEKALTLAKHTRTVRANTTTVDGNNPVHIGRKPHRDENRKSGNRKAYLKSTVSVKELLQTAKHTKDYSEAGCVVDMLLDSGTLQTKDGLNAINIYKQSRQPQKCLRTLEYVRDKGGRLTAFHYNPCIHALSASRNYAKAHLLFEAMQRHGIAPDVVTYTTVVQMFLKEKNMAKAMDLFQDMSVAGVEPNLWTYSVLMSELSKSGQWEAAMRLYENLESKGLEHNTVTYNSALKACAEGLQWGRAISIFNQMGMKGIERNTITYNTTISACAKGGQWAKATELFEEMERKGIERNTITYSSTISACANGGQWAKAVELFDEMKRKGIERNTITYSSTISACANDGEWAKAAELFDEMKKQGLERDAITYSSTISACANGGQWVKAVELFDEMKKKGLEQDNITYSSTISACGMDRQWRRALDLFNEMKIKGIDRDVITYNAAITACERGGQWQKAVALFDEMADVKVERNEVSYNTVVQALGAHGRGYARVDSLYEEMILKFAAFKKDWSVFNRTNKLDLHGHSVYLAQVAIRRLLRKLQKKGDSRSAHNAKLKIVIVVGKGNNSVGDTVLRKAVQAQLHTLTPPIVSHTLSDNTGCLGLVQTDLDNWLAQNAKVIR
ncbi:hypothetical protein SARC_09582 [Sphaeroforma arctica JP610]|uniref:PROP1-like PPR domain-containing protein n=1 Tax=Sphaeroforma arctica JP610 TaxID=667725 RepID=A0A0L0FNA6_9EUKA|nr:hypothetical protein SARC_09582 [Sphaeroforma arctica JP610]KNC77971.1 hypothetical protein SARC_09582 [Sphaeroforma arctica JP610]|eukprot:XP_014151873.1 hypothetical protein SARC_09582 [Sphaeroforma arctica JP610]